MEPLRAFGSISEKPFVSFLVLCVICTCSLSLWKAGFPYIIRMAPGPPKGPLRQFVEVELASVLREWRTHRSTSVSSQVCLPLHESLYEGALAFPGFEICSPEQCRSSYVNRHKCRLYRTIEKVLSR